MKQNERTNKKLDHFPEDEDNEKSDNLKSNKEAGRLYAELLSLADDI